MRIFFDDAADRGGAHMERGSAEHLGDVENNLHDYYGDVHYSNHPGDTAEYTFAGTGVVLLAEKFRDLGRLDVFLDGRPRGSVQLKQIDFPRLAQIPLCSAQGFRTGTHTLRIVNASSDYITIDAFVVTAGIGSEAVK